MNEQEAVAAMVKGVTRRVVVVRAPDEGAPFEQAVFFLRDERMQKKDVLREACAVAETYLYTMPRRARHMRRSVWQLGAAFACGAASTGIVWLLLAVIF